MDVSPATVRQFFQAVPAFVPGGDNPGISPVTSRWRPRFARYASPLVARAFLASYRLPLLGYRSFQVEGADNLPRLDGKPRIFIANHSSYDDAATAVCTITRYYKQMPWQIAAANLWTDNKFYGAVFPIMGALPFERTSPPGLGVGEQTLSVLERLKPAVSILRAGQSLLLFPEATIPGELQRCEGPYMKLRTELEATTGLLNPSPISAILASLVDAETIILGLSGLDAFTPAEIVPEKLFKQAARRTIPVIVRIGKPIPPSPELADLSPIKAMGKGARLMRDQIMPVMSGLIDPTLHYLPFATPLTPADYQRFREHEERIAEIYRRRHAQGSDPKADMFARFIADTHRRIFP